MIMAALARLMEDGRTIVVTKQMKRFFEFLLAEEIAKQMKPDKDGKSSEGESGPKIERTSKATRVGPRGKSVLWLQRMAAMHIGAIMRVPARPFMRPALERAAREFRQDAARDPKWRDHLMEFWYHGQSRTSKLVFSGRRPFA